jgi:cell wall-associated NlpC family hydrolase
VRALQAVSLIALLAGCTKPAGGPLAQTFDSTRLAAIALDQKQAVAQAQQDHELALARHAKADDDYQSSEIEQEIAEYQAQRSVLVVQLVGTKLNDRPQPGTETASLARKTADAKVEFTRARRAWLHALSTSTLYDVYAAQAKLELERAKLAQTSGVTPAGFDLTGFVQQAEQRQRAARTADDETEKQREIAGAKLTAWNELERSFIQTSGMKAPSESERAVLEWKQTAPTAIEAATPAAEPAKP